MGVQKRVSDGLWTFHKALLAAHGIEAIDNRHGEVEFKIIGFMG
jgi:hypothetical protein